MIRTRKWEDILHSKVKSPFMGKIPESMKEAMKKMGTNMDPGKASKEYSKEDIEFSFGSHRSGTHY